MNSGLASGRKRRQRTALEVRDMTPTDAYKKGYAHGYNRAYHYWKRWAERQTRRTA